MKKINAGNDYTDILERANRLSISKADYTKKASVIVPVYNRAPLLGKCLAALTKQTYPKELTEILVVDDGSSDDVLSVIRRYERLIDLRYYRQPDEGYRLAAARNIGLRQSSGDAFVLLDGDVLAMPRDIERFMHIMHVSEMCVLYGHIRYVDANVISDLDILKDIGSVERLPSINPDNDVADRRDENGISVDWRYEHYDKTGYLKNDPWPFMQAAGGNMSFSRHLLELAGYQDEDFNAWGREDAEHAYRMYNAGAYFVPMSDIVSLHQEPSRQEEKYATGKEISFRRKGLEETRQVYAKKCPAPIARECDGSSTWEVPKVSACLLAKDSDYSCLRLIETLLAWDYKDLEICLFMDIRFSSLDEMLEKICAADNRLTVHKIDITAGKGVYSSMINKARGMYILESTSGEFLAQVKVKDLVKTLDTRNVDAAVEIVGIGHSDISSDCRQLEEDGKRLSRALTDATSDCHLLYRKRLWYRAMAETKDLEAVGSIRDWIAKFNIERVAYYTGSNGTNRLEEGKKHSGSTGSSEDAEEHSTQNLEEVQEECTTGDTVAAKGNKGRISLNDIHKIDEQSSCDCIAGLKTTAGIDEEKSWESIVRTHRLESDNPSEWLAYAEALIHRVVSTGDEGRLQQEAALAFNQAGILGASDRAIRKAQYRIALHSLINAMNCIGATVSISMKDTGSATSKEAEGEKVEARDYSQDQDTDIVTKVLVTTRHLIRESMTVLVVGSSSPSSIGMLLEGGFNVAVFDANKDSIQHCRDALVMTGNERLQLVDADPGKLVWPSKSFDIIIYSRGIKPGIVDSWAIRHYDYLLLKTEGLVTGAVPELGCSFDHIDETGFEGAENRITCRMGPVRAERARGSGNDTNPFPVIRTLDFPSRYAGSFRQVDSSFSQRESTSGISGLRGCVIRSLSEVGYSNDSQSQRLVLTPRHKWEDRSLPLLLYKRGPASMPVIQYDIQGGLLTLWIYGPVQEDRKSMFIRHEVNCASLFKTGDILSSDYHVETTMDGIAHGVHALERFLRSASIDNHHNVEWRGNKKAYLDTLISQSSARGRVLKDLFSEMQPFTLYTGHDCYDEAVDVNCSLQIGMPVVLQPKGKQYHFYEGECRAGQWDSGRSVFFSHLYFRFKREVDERWSSLDLSLLDEARTQMERRMRDVSVLPYMRNVIYRDRESDTWAGWQKFKEQVMIPIYKPAEVAKTRRVVWVLAFHSFADEAFRWGMDQIWSLYDMFLLAARHIRDEFPLDLIVLRPHPINLGLFTDPNVIIEIENGRVQDPSGLLDVYLQIRLCKDIAALGVECVLSGLEPVGEVLKPKGSVIITRHGNIVLEGAWMNRPSVFSRIAPYSFMFPEYLQYIDSKSLRASITYARSLIDNEDFSGPRQQDIARYQALLNTPHGVPLRKGMGEVMMPTVTHDPIRSFDDFRYGSESVEEAAIRLLSLLNADVERTALMETWGWE